MYANFFRYWGKTPKKAVSRAGSRREDHHLLVCHCLDVAAVCNELLRHDRARLKRLARTVCSPEDETLSLVTLLVALHDLGKFAPPFQDQRFDLVQKLAPHRGLDVPAGWRPHDEMGRDLWVRSLRQGMMGNIPIIVGGEVVSDLEDVAAIWSPWIRAVTGHHGEPPRRGVGDPWTQVSAQDAIEFAGAAARLLGTPALRSDLPDCIEAEEAARRSSWWLSGLTILCDWIGSDKSVFRYEEDPAIGLEAYYEHARKLARAALDRSGVLLCRPSATSCVQSLFPRRFGTNFDPSPLQRHCQEFALPDGPQLHVLEDMTGAGKTEGACLLAHRLMQADLGSGLYWAQPTQATANAAHARLLEALPQLYQDGETPSMVLAHGGRHVRLNEGGEDGDEQSASSLCSDWIADNQKKALLAHMAAGTIDQALRAALPVLHGTLRLFGLSSNVLVVDEVHAYDAYMLKILCKLLEFHAALGGSAVLLSATLPVGVRGQLVAAFRTGLAEPAAPAPEATEFPLATCVSRDGVACTALEVRPGTERSCRVRLVHSQEVADHILIRAAQQKRCAVCIHNTVRAARSTYKRLQKHLGDRVILFHSRFTAQDRAEIEDRLHRLFGPKSSEQDRAGWVVVATQVVEQSLDLDFDEMVTDLCPIDLLLQRLGRLRRHARAWRGGETVLHVVSQPVEDNPEPGWMAQWVYPATHLLWLTARLFVGDPEIRLPKQSRSLVEAVYASRDPLPPGMDQARRRWERDMREDRTLGSLSSLNLSDGYASVGAFLREDLARTRLGEPDSSIFLGRADGDAVVPLCSTWEGSRVSYRRGMVAEADAPAGLEQAAAQVREGKKIPKHGVLLVLFGEGEMSGYARNPDGDAVRVAYCRQLGFSASR